jgi:hypothetical protein
MKKKFKNDVLLIHFYYTDEKSFASTRHKDFLNYLGLKKKIIVIGANFHHLKKNTIQNKTNNFKVLAIKNLKYHNNFFRLLSIIHFCIILFTKYRSYFKDSKHIISTSPDLIVSSFTILLSNFYKKKCLLEIRDIWPLSLVTQKNISKVNPLYYIFKYLEKYIYKNSYKIFSNLKFFNLRLKELNIKKNFFYIPDLIYLKKLPIRHKKKKLNIIFCSIENKANNFDTVYTFIKKMSCKFKYINFYIFLYNSSKKYKVFRNIVFRYDKSQQFIENFISKKDINFGLSAINYSELYKYGCSPRKFKLYKEFSIPNINLCLKKDSKHEFWRDSYNLNYLKFNFELSEFVFFQNTKKYDFNNNKYVKKNLNLLFN